MLAAAGARVLFALALWASLRRSLIHSSRRCRSQGVNLRQPGSPKVISFFRNPPRSGL